MTIEKTKEKNITTVMDAPHISMTAKEASKEKLKALMQEESRVVRGIFQCFETPGATVRIQQKKYPGPEKGGIPAFDKTMTDGMEYEVPIWVARWLNGIDKSATAVNGRINSCAYPVHGFMMSGNELAPSGLGSVEGMSGVPVPIVGVNKWKKRFGFQSLEFAGMV